VPRFVARWHRSRDKHLSLCKADLAGARIAILGCQGTVPAALPLFAAVGITGLLGWHRKPRWRPDNATRYVDELSAPCPADTQSDETPGAVWASLAGGLICWVHQVFRFGAPTYAMALGFIEGDLVLLELLGLALAVLGMLFWSHW